MKSYNNGWRLSQYGYGLLDGFRTDIKIGGSTDYTDKSEDGYM